ncbi:TetR/AcrR family transcriptional regulator [Streptomyces sp. NBC_01310]|uniref:TetR/AcrR family transcriptional regulator n=1 Tax=Streptomyces sp. NBC_01310 TaxID=2903820 RepID=UPI0035B67BA0|nr:TetR/AcrR family transcriptional regulator [Streptomyces sp. NBC_01310]WSJ63817.1 TetR/AcrR family transcriptional regulator [Streptomyces sp. NBC_01310]
MRAATRRALPAGVARAVGVTKGAAYHHFDSKAGLFRAVVSQVQQELGERVAAAAERHENLWEQLRAGCRAFLAAGTDPAVRRILLVDAPTVLGWDEWRTLDDQDSPWKSNRTTCPSTFSTAAG